MLNKLNSYILSQHVTFQDTYLLLTEFEVHTVSYTDRVFSRLGHKPTGKKRVSVSYSTDRENEVSEIFLDL